MKITIKFEAEDTPPFIVDHRIHPQTAANAMKHPSYALPELLAAAMRDAAVQFFVAACTRAGKPPQWAVRTIDKSFVSLCQDPAVPGVGAAEESSEDEEVNDAS